MTDESKTMYEPETYSRAHVQMLREENRGLRDKMHEHGEVARRARADADWAREQADATREIAHGRVLHAELRTAATRAGIIDLDALKMADPSGMALDATGTVQGADDVVAALRRNKPYLFGSGQGENAGAPKTRHASEMSKEEFERELKKLTRR